jgi:hypothetical protein
VLPSDESSLYPHYHQFLVQMEVLRREAKGTLSSWP